MELDKILDNLGKTVFMKGMDSRHKPSGNWGKDVAQAKQALIDWRDKEVQKTIVGELFHMMTKYQRLEAQGKNPIALLIIANRLSQLTDNTEGKHA